MKILYALVGTAVGFAAGYFIGKAHCEKKLEEKFDQEVEEYKDHLRKKILKTDTIEEHDEMVICEYIRQKEDEEREKYDDICTCYRDEDYEIYEEPKRDPNARPKRITKEKSREYLCDMGYDEAFLTYNVDTQELVAGFKTPVDPLETFGTDHMLDDVECGDELFVVDESLGLVYMVSCII